jgi:hypothetical protein
MGHAEVQTPPQSRDRGFAVVVFAVPRPLTDNRDLSLRTTELAFLHAALSRARISKRTRLNTSIIAR